MFVEDFEKKMFCFVVKKIYKLFRCLQFHLAASVSYFFGVNFHHPKRWIAGGNPPMTEKGIMKIFRLSI